MTDADVVLGYINPEYFHGGAIELDRGRAERAIEQKVAEPLGIPVEEAALMIRRIVDGNMGQAIWRETVLKGFDPREFILFAFGGAGPTHCCGYARAAEMDTVVIFPFAPTFCAFGSSTMDIVHLYERSRQLHLLDPATHEYLTDYDGFNETVEGLEELARRDFPGEGYDEDRIEYTLELDMKFGGQLNVKRATSPVLRIRSEEDVVRIRESFEREYAEAYSSLGVNPDAGIEIHDFVLRGRVAQPKSELPRFTPRARTRRRLAPARAGPTGAMPGWVDTPVYRQDALRCGNVVAGPALIEAEDTTIVVEPEWTFRVGEYMDGIMEFSRRDEGERRSRRCIRAHADRLDGLTGGNVFDLALVEEGIKPFAATPDELEAVESLGRGDYEIYSEMLTIIAQEGKEIMTKMGISSMLHSGDSVAAIYTARGDLVTAVLGTYLHCVTGQIPVKFILKYWRDNPTVGVRPGDVFYCNEAIYGGIHNPDQFAIVPVFHDDELIAWCVVGAHQSETGGSEPGGEITTARSRHDEGMKLTPIKIGEHFSSATTC